MSLDLHSVRDRFHPLSHLRRRKLSRAILRAIDVPIWAKMPGIEWRVRARLISHASVFILPGGAEPGISAWFRVIGKDIGIRSFWDVGANVGYYGWLTKSIAPGAEVRMFEPDSDNVTLLEKTLLHANLDGVTLRKMAVSDRGGQRRFMRDEIAGSAGGIQEAGTIFCERERHGAASTVLVNTISLDEERVHSHAVDLIKIDVEGHEEAVIRGGRDTIARDQPILIFECFHGGAEITSFLSAVGYRIGDAERTADGTPGTTNFLALPARHRAIAGELEKHWAAEMARIGK